MISGINDATIVNKKVLTFPSNGSPGFKYYEGQHCDLHCPSGTSLPVEIPAAGKIRWITQRNIPVG